MNIDYDDVLAVLAHLNERDRHLVHLRFWEALAWPSVAVRMGFADAAAAEQYWDDTVAPAIRERLGKNDD